MFRMFSNHKARSSQRSKFSLQGRSLRYETMEGRLVLSASGFAGNECAPEFLDAQMDTEIPTGPFSPGTSITFQFNAADIVIDEGVGATPTSDIRFILDPDVEANFRGNGATPIGATLVANDPGVNDQWDFSWTPTDMQIGTYRLFIIATDNGGEGGENPVVPLSDVFAFELTIDNKPSVDLNGGDGGIQTGAGIDFGPVAYTEGDGAARIVDTDLSIPFAANNMVTSATVTIDSPQPGAVETLDIIGGSLIVDRSTPGQLVITVDGGGQVDKSVFEAALETLTYENSSDDPTLGATTATQTVSVTINDGNSESDAAKATIELTGTNDRPVLIPDDGNLPDALVGVEYTFEVVAEDPDGGDFLVFQLQLAPEGAVITPNAGAPAVRNTIQVARDTSDGLFHAQIVWTPTEADGDVSPNLFRVSVTDTGGLADSEDYSVAIENQSPIANDDPTTQDDPWSIGEDDGSTVLGDILDNDTDADDDTLVVNAAFADGTPIELDTSVIHPVSGARMTLSSGGQLTYSPNGAFESLADGETTTDTFSYTAVDENGNESNEATVTITIIGANDAPVAITDDTNPNFRPEFTISEDATAEPLDTASIVAAATDVDNGDTLSIVEAPEDPTEGDETLGTFTFTPATGDPGTEVLSFDPNESVLNLGPDDSRTIDVMVKVQDAAGAETTVPVRIIVVGVNESPVANDDPAVGDEAAYTTDEDTELSVATRGILTNDTDTDTDPLTLLVDEFTYSDETVSAGTSVTHDDGSQLQVNADGSFTFNPGDDFDSLNVDSTPAEVTFTYKATDGNSQSSDATVTITVTGSNDAPEAADTTVSAMEDSLTGVMGSFAGSDVDDTTLTYEITQDLALTGEGSVTNNDDGTFTFLPGDDFQELAAGEPMDVTFSYKAIDAALAESTEATVTVTVTGVNDAPVFDMDGLAAQLSGTVSGSEIDVELAQDSPLSADLSAFTSDIDGDNAAITFSRVSNGVPGLQFRNTNLPILSSGGQLSWTPDADLPLGDYVIRIAAADTAPQSSVLDIVVSVVTSNPPAVNSVTETIDVSETESLVVIQFNKIMGTSAIAAENYSVTVVDGAVMGTAVTILDVASSDSTEVTLALSDATVNFAQQAGGTMLTLTLDSDILDADGNAITGTLEFQIELVTPA